MKKTFNSINVQLSKYSGGLKYFVYLLIFTTLIITPTMVIADCFYNGLTYPEGSIIGNLICSNGQWIPR